MDFERHLIAENPAVQEFQEIEPKGIIIYSSGIPIYREFQLKVFDRPNFRASVHALIDEDGVTQMLPLNYRGMHAGVGAGNNGYLGVMVCEPNPDRKAYQALRDSARNNLVQYLVFLCRYWAIEPVNVSNVIQFAGTASKNHIVDPEVMKFCKGVTPYFGRPADCPEADDELYCNENSIITEVKQTLGQIAALYGEVTHTTETPLTQIGVGDVVLFTGGDVFKSRGSSTRVTFDNRMRHGIISEMSPGSRHAYKVTFPGGSSVWVNKSTLERSTLGHVSF